MILRDELLELRLHVDDFLGREVELHDGDFGFFEVGEEADFAGLQEHQGAAFAVGTAGGTADAVDVVARIIWRVELYNPVYVWDLERLLGAYSRQKGRWGRRTSKPLAATSVQTRTPCFALQNSKKVLLRLSCFCLPWRSRTGRSI